GFLAGATPRSLPEDAEVAEQPPQEDEDDDRAEAAAPQFLGPVAGGHPPQQLAHASPPRRHAGRPSHSILASGGAAGAAEWRKEPCPPAEGGLPPGRGRGGGGAGVGGAPLPPPSSTTISRDRTRGGRASDRGDASRPATPRRGCCTSRC